MTRRLGIAANVLGLVCIMVALVKHETGDVVIFGALDRQGAVVTQPGLAGWLIAAVLLVVVGTALLLRR